MTEQIILDGKQLRLRLLYEFRKHVNARDAAKNICEAMGPSTVSYDTAKVWSRKFKNDTFDKRPGRRIVLEEERLLELIEEDSRRDTRSLAEEL
ncbi:unnamed protein product [Nippostrongylus brasiliensis]|uniref:HTH_48 domain-containing protein n=1 Tax=Nippostrongylus brasiliensis TaxID=27835 RepID=A0A0N4XXS2_NIPBR|nr:unnamed protein product [Nippostrongylus brasiliensis]